MVMEIIKLNTESIIRGDYADYSNHSLSQFMLKIHPDKMLVKVFLLEEEKILTIN